VRFRQNGLHPGVLDATRLVTAGHLAEATAILQRSLGIDATAPTPERGSPGGRTDAFRERFRPAPPMPPSEPAPPAAEPEGWPGAGEFLRRSYRNEAGICQYRLYVPSGYRGEPAPLVVLLHGCKQSPEDFAAGTRMNAHAERLGWLVAYPEQSSAANGSRCWNWFRPADQQRGRGEPALVAGITRQVMNDFAIDPARVYVAGLSAGGAAAAIMGSAYPDLYAGVGIHSGLAPGAAQDVLSAFAAMRHGGRVRPGPGGTPILPMIVFHGDRDRTVNPQNAEMILAQAAAGIELDKHVARGQVPGGHAYTLTRYTDPSGRVLLESWLVHGAGHAWAGGSPEGSYTDPNGPDATAEMFRFFASYQRAMLG